MELHDIWFGLFVLIVAGYLVLDGFDFGVGMLHLPVAKNDTERRLTLNSIGPIWDGNEVWLVITGGVLFAAFPVAFAALFSGFYLAFMLFLLVLILRTVSIEFRGERQSPRWRSFWDGVFALSSLSLALILGLAFANIIRGVPIDENGDVEISNVFDLFRPFALWLGATTAVMLALHGAMYLNLKTESELQGRVRQWIPRLFGAFVVMGVVSAVWIVDENSNIADVYEDIWPLIFPMGAVIALLVGVRAFIVGRDGVAFAASAALIVMLLCTVSAGLYPNLLTSSTDASNSLTTGNASSQDNTLTVLLVITAIGMPFVVLYLAGVNYFFRGKVRLGRDSY